MCDAVSVVKLYSIECLNNKNSLVSYTKEDRAKICKRNSRRRALSTSANQSCIRSLNLPPVSERQQVRERRERERESERAVWRQCVDYALLKHAAGKNELAVRFVVCDVIVVQRFCALIKHSYQPDMKMICRCFTLWHSSRAMAVPVPEYKMEYI